MTFPGLPSTFPAALVSAHALRIRVEVLDLAGEPTGQRLTPRVLDGAVQCDSTAEVSRSATLTFLDPERQLAFDSNSPADGALYADRMLRVWYDVRRPGGQWIGTPVITGPLVKFVRNGATVDVEVHSKERLAMGAAWRTKTYKKNTPKRDVIEDVMRKEGERDFALDNITAKMPADKSLVPETVPWAFVRDVARSSGLDLYYDGMGRLRLRRSPESSVWTFKSGDGGTVMTQPKVTFDIGSLKNAVRVVGKKPAGAKTKVRATAVAPSGHPLSPFRLGRNGEGRYLAEFIDDASIGSTAEAKRVAQQRLAALLLMLVTVEFDSLVVPHLDLGDVATLRTDDFTLTFRLTRFTIPLTASGTMAVGYNKQVRRPAAPKGRKK